MTTPPDPYADPPRDPDTPENPYGSPGQGASASSFAGTGRPHQQPLAPFTPPVEDAPQDGGQGWAAPAGAGGRDPYGTPPPTYGTPAPYGSPSPYGGGPGAGGPPSPYGPPAPYGGYPGPGYAVPYTPPTPTNGLAVASMIVSIASLLICIGMTGVVGLVLGIVALNQVMRDGSKGKGFAITGIAVGAVGTVLLGLLLIGIATDA